jgi:hypothetical protein
VGASGAVSDIAVRPLYTRPAPTSGTARRQRPTRRALTMAPSLVILAVAVNTTQALLFRSTLAGML